MTARNASAVVAVTAGRSQPSSSRLLADRLVAATATRIPNARTTVIALRALAHPIADATLTGFATGALADAIETLRAADAVIMVAPVFNTSYSGLFKSFVDVLEPGLLADKPVALGATGGTARHSLALEFAYRPLFAYLKATVAPTGVFAAAEDFGTHGSALAERIDTAATELAGLVLDRPTTAPNDPFADPVSFDRLLAG